MRHRLHLNLFACALSFIGGAVSAQQTPSEATLRESVQKSLLMLETASAGTAEQRMCFTCHGQAQPVIAIVEAQKRGFKIDGDNLKRQLEHTAAFLRRGRKSYLAGKGQGGRVDTAGYALWALSAADRTSDEITDAVVEYVLSTDVNAQRWKHSSNRPPSEASDFTTTYLALRALSEFGTPEQQSRISERNQSVLHWLLEAEPHDTEDRVFHLLALSHLMADRDVLRRSADSLIQLQREDGGWAQRTDMESDAYATGTALVCLARANGTTISSEPYRNGLLFLLSTQHDDGTWYVASRSKPFQKQFESGFPYGEDQFISTSATAWATLAMLLALPEEIR